MFLRRSVLRRLAFIAVPASTVVAAGALEGCLERPIAPVDPITSSTFTSSVETKAITKIDILLMIDNSQSMQDKQEVLYTAIPTLVDRLVNPWCASGGVDGGTVTYQNPPQPPCTAGYSQEFTPIQDIHIGVVTSSLGGHGAPGTCLAEATQCSTEDNPTNNDQGHLVDRTSANPAIGTAACGINTAPVAGSYNGLNFLAWGGTGGQTTEGVAALAANYPAPGTGLLGSVQAIVTGVGQMGCGYESQIESWYRFLVEPEPWTSISVPLTGTGIQPAQFNAEATYDPTNTDFTLLQQRAEFLRPDSLLAIIGVSDENDTSFQDGSVYWIAGWDQNGNTEVCLPMARQECATNPDDPCCASCIQAVGATCPPSSQDPNCAEPNGAFACNNPNGYTVTTDAPNQRGWNNKQRFGINFLYPIQRYINGLTLTTVQGTQTRNSYPNPIFSNITAPAGYPGTWVPQAAGTPRQPGDETVFLAYIVGVPWQDIAVNPNDLTQGYKNNSQMLAPIAAGQTANTWDVILGTPIDMESTPPPGTGITGYTAPLDPHMIESVTPRTGTNPITGTALCPPPQPGTVEAPNFCDPINGHEWTPELEPLTAGGTDTKGPQYDLEYACIFPLPQGRDCTNPANFSCDCTSQESAADNGAFNGNDNPLCVANPTTPADGNTYQAYAKGYPGIRELSLVKALGSQGIVGSICPKQLTDATKLDYGYNPTVNGIIERLKAKLGGQCLPEQLTLVNGNFPCKVLEVTPGVPKGSPACASLYAGQPQAAARTLAVPDEYVDLESNPEYVQTCMTLPDGGATTVDSCCVYEITQLTDTLGIGTAAYQCGGTPQEPLQACECLTGNDQSLTLGATPVNGWCYIDPTENIGNAALVTSCASTAKRKIRFVGEGYPKGVTYITCQSAD
jgi:hypothetical protein